jgi:uncharacterized phage protein (TIGR02220 family)
VREYGKLHSSFWTSPTIRAVSEDGRTLAAYLLSSPHSNMLGCFRIPDGYVCEDLGWDSERVTKGFAELFNNGFATRSEGSKWVVIHKFLKWNQPENPNVVKAAEKLFDQIPVGSGVKPLLVAGIREFEPRFNPSKLKGFETVSEGLPKGIPPEPEPEPQPEPEPEKEESLSGEPDDADDESDEGEVEVQAEKPVREILDYLNLRTGAAFRMVDSNTRLIQARLDSGATAEQIKAVIDVKVKEWAKDRKWSKYLRPKTLFNATNFEQYLGELPKKQSRSNDDARFEN